MTGRFFFLLVSLWFQHLQQPTQTALIYNFSHFISRQKVVSKTREWREKPRRRCPCGSDQWERLLTCEWNGSPPGIDSQRQCLGPFAAAPACSERSTGPGERVVLIQCTAGALSRTGRETESGGGTRWGVHSQLGVCSASGSSSCLLRSSAPAGWNVAGCSGWLQCNGQCFHGWICCKAHKSVWSAGPSCGYHLPQLLYQMKTQNRVWKTKLLAAKTCWLCYLDIRVRRYFNGNLLSSVTMSCACDSIQFWCRFCLSPCVCVVSLLFIQLPHTVQRPARGQRATLNCPWTQV